MKKPEILQKSNWFAACLVGVGLYLIFHEHNAEHGIIAFTLAVPFFAYREKTKDEE